jgi:hypothetical protein
MDAMAAATRSFSPFRSPSPTTVRAAALCCPSSSRCSISKTNTTKRYYSAFLGEHPREATSPNRQFAPLSIPGRAVFCETVRFYPAGEALPRLVDAQGEYAFRLQLNTATPPEPSLIDRLQGRTQPAPIAFQMTLPWMSDQHLGFRRATIGMHAKDWKPTATAAR